MVAASAPTVELFGYFDVALGHFSTDMPLLDGVHPILKRHFEALQHFEFARPQELVREGLVPAKVMFEWADAVWAEDSADA